MELPTTRIELSGGQWVVLYDSVKRKTARLQEAELRKHLRPLDEEPLMTSELASGEKGWPTNFVVNAAAVDNGAVTEAYLLNQVKEWSFGPVTQETIDELSREAFDELQAKMDELYEAHRPLAGSGGAN